jgi:ribonuclease P protein subunit RPR2
VGDELKREEAVKSVARRRVFRLFLLAREIYGQDPLLAQRYVDMARRIAMAANIRLPKEFRLQVCRHCKSFILPGVSCRVRIKRRREPHVVITCLNCGRYMRIPLKSERGKKRE